MTQEQLVKVIRSCYACGSNNTVQYQYPHGIAIGELWYTNKPTDLVLCNKCYCYLIKNPRHDSLCQPGITYSYLRGWIRKNRPKPSVCEQCDVNPPREVANIDGIYEKDISHFRWVCVPCHTKLDGRGRHHSSRVKRRKLTLSPPPSDRKINKSTYAKVTITWPASLLRAVDSGRDLIPRSVFITHCLESWLAKEIRK